jgi:hypothetical protein
VLFTNWDDQIKEDEMSIHVHMGEIRNVKKFG